MLSLIGLSPLTTAHPNSFQPKLVRTSTKFYLRFILAMVRSLSFGSIRCDSGTVSTRHRWTCFRYGSPRLSGLTLPHSITRRIIMQKARCHPFPAEAGHRAPTACKRMISGSISLPLQGCFSIFPHGTCSLSVAG